MRRGFLIAVAVALAAASCSGPEPVVHGHDVHATASGLRIEVDLANDGGEGQVELRVIVRDAAGAVVARTSEAVPVGSRERRRVPVDVALPAGELGRDPAAWRVAVEARHPVE